MPYDSSERLGHSEIQHGPYSDRVYLMKLDQRDMPEIVEAIEALAQKHGYTKIFAKVAAAKAAPFLAQGYQEEAAIPGFYQGKEKALFLAKYRSADRASIEDPQALKEVLRLAQEKARKSGNPFQVPEGVELISCGAEDAEEMSAIYRQVFPSYPFPIHDPAYLCETMESHIDYFGIQKAGKLIALSSAEMDLAGGNVEMTDFATLPAFRGQGLARCLLQAMEVAMRKRKLCTAYTIARAISPGMNITFSQLGYRFSGLLINNTQISGAIESMNIWHKSLL